MQLSLTQRQVALSMMIVLIVIDSIALVVMAATGAFASIEFLATAVALPLFALLLFLYWRGWDAARYALIIVITVLSVLSLDEPYLTTKVSLSIIIPMVIAVVLAGPWWTVSVGVASLAAITLRAGFQGEYVNPLALLIYLVIVIGLALSQIVATTAIRTAEHNATQAEEQRMHAAQALSRVEQQAHELAQRSDEQQRLIDLVTTLETPTIAIAAGVLLAPVVGTLDSRRADALMTRLLKEVTQQRARLVILDIAGVSFIDTEVANALFQTARAIRLLGCQVTLTGISSNVATTLTHLNISFTEIATARSPQEVLREVYKVEALAPNIERRNSS